MTAMSLWSRTLVACCAAGVALLTACSPSSSEAAGRPSTPAQVGEGWDFSTPDGAGRITMHGAGWRDEYGGSSSTPPPRNGGYLVMDVEVRVDSGAYYVSEFDWSAQDPAGHVWDCTGSHLFDPGFPSTTVRAGDHVRGNVVCDAPRDAMVVKVGGGPAWSVPA